MRSPEIIKNITQSSLLYIQESNIVRKEAKSLEFEVESNPIVKKKINKGFIWLLNKFLSDILNY